MAKAFVVKSINKINDNEQKTSEGSENVVRTADKEDNYKNSMDDLETQNELSVEGSEQTIANKEAPKDSDYTTNAGVVGSAAILPNVMAPGSNRLFVEPEVYAPNITQKTAEQSKKDVQQENDRTDELKTQELQDETGLLQDELGSNTIEPVVYTAEQQASPLSSKSNEEIDGEYPVDYDQGYQDISFDDDINRQENHNYELDKESTTSKVDISLQDINYPSYSAAGNVPNTFVETNEQTKLTKEADNVLDPILEPEDPISPPDPTNDNPGQDNPLPDNSENITISSNDKNADISLDTGEGSDDVQLTGRYDTADVDTGAGNDNVTITSANKAADISVDSGSGDDTVTLSGKYANVTIDTGAGDDSITLIGKYANAKIISGEGDDTFISKGKGNDTYEISGGNFGHDTFDAGKGKADSISLSPDSEINIIDAGENSWIIEIDGHTATLNTSVDGTLFDNQLVFNKSASGQLVMDDGSRLDFDNIESVDW